MSLKVNHSNELREQRIRAAQKHLEALTPVPDLIRAFVAQWGVAKSTARRYITEARKRIEGEAIASRQFVVVEHAAIVRQQLRALAESTDRRDRKLLLEFLQYEAQIHGLLVSPRVRHREAIAESVDRAIDRGSTRPE